MSVSEVGSYGLWMLMVSGFGNYGIGLGLDPSNPASIYQNLHFCRVPINSILGFIITTYKQVGYGSLR